ncbi:MAG: RNA-guided endonuclease InsQ/TnpB family protein [Candidatus Hodarchaeota archaeon]
MLRFRAYKYELRLNNHERTILSQCAGTARFAWNWGLVDRLKRFQTQTGPTRFTTAMAQHRAINRLKQTKFDWMYQYSKCIPQESLRDLERAFKNFQKNWKTRQAGQTCRYVGFPKFKKKGRCKDSFRLTGVIKILSESKSVQLPRLGKLRVKETPKLSETARILSATVSRKANRWYVSFTVEESHPEPIPIEGQLLALDKGLKIFAGTSLGLLIPKPQFLLRQERKLRKLSKSVSRKKAGSQNRKKAVDQLARFHAHVTNTRHDFLHKNSAIFAKNHSVIVVEDLNIQGLKKNKKMSKYWNNLAHGEFQRQFDYKTDWYGSKLVKVDRFFPSSKLCSNCLYYQPDLTLADRSYRCPLCGLVLDRDYNAALNLENYYHKYKPQLTRNVAESSAETLNACGEVVRPMLSRHTSMNQEESISLDMQ